MLDRLGGVRRFETHLKRCVSGQLAAPSERRFGKDHPLHLGGLVKT